MKIAETFVALFKAFVASFSKTLQSTHSLQTVGSCYSSHSCPEIDWQKQDGQSAPSVHETTTIYSLRQNMQLSDTGQVFKGSIPDSEKKN